MRHQDTQDSIIPYYLHPEIALAIPNRDARTSQVYFALWITVSEGNTLSPSHSVNQWTITIFARPTILCMNQRCMH
jgi:hypothetical protein